MKRWPLWAPLGLFLALFAVVASGLVAPKSPAIRSHLVGKPLPMFALPGALPGRPGLTNVSFATGKPRLLNVFASWCVPCIAEAPQLMALKQAGVPIDAVAIRDRPEDVAAFLARWGDPYEAIAADRDSSLQIAIGSSGVPETFVIDGHGVIRHQHIGDIRAEDVPELLTALAAAR